MKPKGILFNTAMVRAILNGRKTMTRRVVKPQPDEEMREIKEGLWHGYFDDGFPRVYHAPYSPGDILYVRETWAAWSRTDGLPPVLVYKASENAPDGVKWRPSIHMPREAARIFLKVTDVRVERLQDINIEDTIKKGCSGVPCDCMNEFTAGGIMCCVDCMNTGWLEPPTVEFMELWDSTIRQADLPRYGWDANPWVWAISFERIRKDGLE